MFRETLQIKLEMFVHKVTMMDVNWLTLSV